jgi:hypothetical protein
MPANVARTPAEEIAWGRAKVRVRQEYPEARGAWFYRLAMTIYTKIAHHEPQRSAATDRLAAAGTMR